MPLTVAKVELLFASPLFHQQYIQGDDPNAKAALPDFSLNFLIDLCHQQQIKNVFEFGSGRSTKALLNMGCSVTSLEDSAYWMNQTLQMLDNDEKTRHSCYVRPLKTQFLNLFPVKDWMMDDQLINALQAAELVLVDSPYYTPFRESTLWSALNFAKDAIVILDDTRIPTLRRFCDRIASANKSLLHQKVMVGHGFDIFYVKHGNNQNKLRLNHSLIDIAKGWYRFIQGNKFYRNLNKHP